MWDLACTKEEKERLDKLKKAEADVKRDEESTRAYWKPVIDWMDCYQNRCERERINKEEHEAIFDHPWKPTPPDDYNIKQERLFKESQCYKDDKYQFLWKMDRWQRSDHVDQVLLDIRRRAKDKRDATELERLRVAKDTEQERRRRYLPVRYPTIASIGFLTYETDEPTSKRQKLAS